MVVLSGMRERKVLSYQLKKQMLTSICNDDIIKVLNEREVNKMNVYVAMVSDYYGIKIMIGVFSTYQKALDYLGEHYANCDAWIKEERIR